MVFPVVTYGCESWTIKKAERWRIDAFELWCWRRLLRVPWTVRRSVLGVHWKDWCWSWSSHTLVTSCEQLTHLKRPWCWERLRAGEGDDRGWDGWMASLTQWTWVWVDSGSWWWTGRPGVLQFMGSQRVGHDWVTELNSAYKLNKQGDYIQLWHTPFPIWNQSVVPCPVLTVASWPAYRFLRRQDGLVSRLFKTRVIPKSSVLSPYWSVSKVYCDWLLLTPSLQLRCELPDIMFS